MDGADRPDPSRRPWHEGPEEGTPAESWLRLDDDELLHKIETVGTPQDGDDQLLEIVASDRHFFLRQEAAKRIRRKKLLFSYEDDRHIGQILVRHLNRREDLTYLERLAARSTFGEVRKAAQVQLSRLRKRIDDQDRRDATRQSQGKAPWRVAVIHADPALRQLVADTLKAPEYEVMGHGAGGAAVAAVKAFDPHLLLAGIEDLMGAGVHTAIRDRGRPLPVVALCEASAAERLPEIVGNGADEFMMLPLLPALVSAKARALLHLSFVAALRAERRKASGTIGEDGVLPLLKLCEDEQLTCRLVVAVDGRRWFADFVGGEMTEAGGVPPVDDDDAFAAMLTVRSGTYEMIEAMPIEEKADAMGAAETPVPQGVVSSTTAGAGTPRVDGEWRAPDVDATLLGWAVHFVVEQAWAHLGTAATTGLLRRTLQDGLERHPVLHMFTVEENAHVGVDLSRGTRLAGEAVGVTAQWMAVFLAAARRIAPDAASIDVREATKIVGGALEQVDFYTAYDRAAGQTHSRPPSHVIGKIVPARKPK